MNKLTRLVKLIKRKSWPKNTNRLVADSHTIIEMEKHLQLILALILPKVNLEQL
jgi:hypothetical protein